MIFTRRKAAPQAPQLPARVAGPGVAENTLGLLIGTKGTGKTTLVRQIIAARARRGGSLVFVDPTGKNGDFGTVVTTDRAFWTAAYTSLQQGQPFRIVRQLEWGKSLKGSRMWEMIFRIGAFRPCVVVLDEVHKVASAHRIEPQLEDFIRMARNHSIDILATTQNLPGVHGVLRANQDWVAAFRSSSQYYANVLNEAFFHLPNGAELIYRLPDFHYLRIESGHLTRGVVDPSG